MPIKDKDFGKYKRPGIFIEEIDNSIIELPVQNVLINLVPGFSKKGPFNAPIYVTNPNDFEAIYGEDDRRLENKGSYFHKTVKQMLKSGPVWALNLLDTNANRDKVDWQSISVSAQYENSDVKRSAYSSFFNRQDFWERDTDAFLNVVKQDNFGVDVKDQLFHITNMGDKDITVFMFKSDVTGFDITAEEWYGDRTKVPAYIDYREWISDYLVSIVILAGDWSDYKTLSNDTTFSKYFNRNGLIKEQVNNLLNERTVSVLGSYDCSLIPYFKDLNSRDMYIKNVINNNTDKTGLFCTYNENVLLEADFKIGNPDIIGDVLVGQNYSSVKFMSYDTSLKEQLTYSQKWLDTSNNVITTNPDSYTVAKTVLDDRTGIWMNGKVFDINYAASNPTTGVTGATYDLDIEGGTYPYYIVDGEMVEDFVTQTITLSGISTSLGSRYDILYMTNDSTVNIQYGVPSNLTTGAIIPDYTLSLESTIILGRLYLVNNGVSGATLTYDPVTVDTSGYVDLASILNYGIEVTDTYDSLGTYLNLEFKGTAGQAGEYSDYKYLRTLQAFNEIYDRITSKSVLVQSGTTGDFTVGNKVPISAIVPVDATTTVNASVKLYVTAPDTCHVLNKFLIYYNDDEFLLHNEVIDTSSLKTRYDVLGTTTKVGIVATYSQLYQDYYNGIINNLDYFYVNNDSGSTNKIMMKMFMNQSELLTVNFLSAINPDVEYDVDNADYEDVLKYNLSLILHSNRSNWEQSVEIEQIDEDDLTIIQKIWVDKNRYSEVTKGSYLAAYYDEDNWETGGAGYLEGSTPRKLTRILDVKNDTNNVDLKILYTDAPIKIVDYDIATGTTRIDYQTFTYPSIDTYVTEYKALKISPFVVHQDSIPDGTDTRQYSILDIIQKDTNLAQALADKNKISWRYLIDSFGLGLEPVENYGSKQQLVDLCGLKLNALGFINMPSARIFRDSTNPSFVDTDGVLDIQYIKAGADDSKNPDYYY